MKNGQIDKALQGLDCNEGSQCTKSVESASAILSLNIAKVVSNERRTRLSYASCKGEFKEDLSPELYLLLMSR